MKELIQKLYEVAGTYSKQLTRMFIFDAVKGLFEGSFLAALLFCLMRMCEHIFDGRTVEMQDIYIVCGISVVSVAGKILFGYLSDRNKYIAAYSLGAENRLLIADRLKAVHMGYFSKNTLGEVAGGLSAVIGELETVGIIIIELLLTGMIQTAVIILFILPYDAVTAIIMFISMAAGAFVSIATQKKCDVLTEKLLTYKLSLSAKMLEYIQGLVVSKIFGGGKATSNELNQSICEAHKGFLAVEKILVPTQALFLLVFKLAACAIITGALMRYFAGSISATKTVILTVMSFVVFSGLELAGSMQGMKGVAVQNLNKTIALRTLPVMSEGKERKVNKAEIVFKDVSFSYKENTRSGKSRNGKADKKNKGILHAKDAENKTCSETARSQQVDGEQLLFTHINLTIPEGKTTALVGFSGSGKTTLCNLAARFYDSESGAVEAGGVNVKDYQYDALLSAFSFVFQDVYLFDDTVRNNLKFGNPDVSDEVMIDIAKKTQCHDFIMQLPLGYDTVLHEGGGNLSGGERQRLSIARAILKDSRFVILDEATSSIDPENERELLIALKHLLQDKTVIVIAHKISTIQYADKIIVLNKGTIEQEGTHADLAERDGTYRSFLKTREAAEHWMV